MNADINLYMHRFFNGELRHDSKTWPMDYWLVGSSVALIILGLIIVACLGSYFYQTEGYLSNSIYMMGMGGAMICALAVLTRRPFTSSLFFASIVTFIAITAQVKYEASGVSLHSWDFIMLAQDWPEVAGWWSGKPWAITLAVIAIISLTLGTILAWRLETPSIARRWPLLAFCLTASNPYNVIMEINT